MMNQEKILRRTDPATQPCGIKEAKSHKRQVASTTRKVWVIPHATVVRLVRFQNDWDLDSEVAAARILLDMGLDAHDARKAEVARAAAGAMRNATVALCQAKFSAAVEKAKRTDLTDQQYAASVSEVFAIRTLREEIAALPLPGDAVPREIV